MKIDMVTNTVLVFYFVEKNKKSNFFNWVLKWNILSSKVNKFASVVKPRCSLELVNGNSDMIAFSGDVNFYDNLAKSGEIYSDERKPW